MPQVAAPARAGNTTIGRMQTTNALRFALNDRIQDAEVGPAHAPLGPLAHIQKDGWDEAAFEEVVRKGTQAWEDVPDDWLENLRSGHG